MSEPCDVPPEDNVIYPRFLTKLDIPPERVLRSALDAGLSDVVVIGYDNDGDEYFASSVADGGTVLWLLERCKLKLLTVTERID